ncbi:hypothetical protein EON63_20610 [archaeon]|nr:MAG: hypothetical protein EON63_20610 [archaeon]
MQVWQRYSEIQAKEALQLASLEDTGMCRQCNEVFILPPGTHILSCPSCHVQTCILCNEAAHPPLKCSEVSALHIVYT